jgi:hypothetical protein
MVSAAGKVILLCDHDKIGRVSFAQFASAAQVGCLVTDRIEEAERAALAKHGVQVLVAARRGTESDADFAMPVPNAPGVSAPVLLRSRHGCHQSQWGRDPAGRKAISSHQTGET